MLANRERRTVPPSSHRQFLRAASVLLLVGAISFLANNRSPSNGVKTQRIAGMYVTRVPLPSAPQQIAAGAGAAWAIAPQTGSTDDTLYRVDARSFEVAEVDLPGRTGAVTVGEEAIWTSICEGNAPDQIARLHPASAEIVASVKVENCPEPFGMVVGDGIVWVDPYSLDDEILRIDNATNRMLEPLGLEKCCESNAAPFLYTYGHGSLWGVGDSSLVRSSPETGQIQETFDVYVCEVVSGPGAIWVQTCGPGLQQRSSVSRVDPETNELVATIPFPDQVNVAVSDEFIWATARTEGGLKVYRIDPRTNRVSGTPILIRTGLPQSLHGIRSEPVFSSVGDRALWIANYSDSELVRIELSR